MRLAKSVWRCANKALDFYGHYHPSVLSIQQFIDFGTKNTSDKHSFLFLRKEIPVRLANIMKEIQLLPEQLLEMPSVKLVQEWYEQSFDEILYFEKVDCESKGILDRFIDSLDKIQNRHLTVVETMAQGVIEMKEQRHEDIRHLEERVHYFLDRFYLSRIGIRLLIHQHLLLFGNLENLARHVGCFDPHCDVLSVAKDAYDNARFLCEQYYETAPLCKFVCHKPFDEKSEDDKITMTYVPAHLYYVLFELFKNALRAVVEFHHESSFLPTLELLICKGREDVVIKLSDQGGGVPRTDIDKLFNYMFSTAPKPPSPDRVTSAPLAGYGYGLPISRLYAKYFNGDLLLNSVDGYGTDAHVYLKVFPKDASELLPVYNKTASQRYATAKQVKDWSEHKSGPRTKGDRFKH